MASNKKSGGWKGHKFQALGRMPGARVQIKPKPPMEKKKAAPAKRATMKRRTR